MIAIEQIRVNPTHCIGHPFSIFDLKIPWYVPDCSHAGVGELNAHVRIRDRGLFQVHVDGVRALLVVAFQIGLDPRAMRPVPFQVRLLVEFRAVLL
jgi:hypothetical protein